MTQHPLFPDPTWTDAFQQGDQLTSRYTTNEGVVEIVKPGRYVLVRWARPSLHVVRHHSPLGLVKA